MSGNSYGGSDEFIFLSASLEQGRCGTYRKTAEGKIRYGISGYFHRQPAGFFGHGYRNGLLQTC